MKYKEISIVIISVFCLISCKKSSESDYREKWIGNYFCTLYTSTSIQNINTKDTTTGMISVSFNLEDNTNIYLLFDPTKSNHLLDTNFIISEDGYFYFEKTNSGYLRVFEGYFKEGNIFVEKWFSTPGTSQHYIWKGKKI